MPCRRLAGGDWPATDRRVAGVAGIADGPEPCSKLTMANAKVTRQSNYEWDACRYGRTIFESTKPQGVRASNSNGPTRADLSHAFPRPMFGRLAWHLDRSSEMLLVHPVVQTSRMESGNLRWVPPRPTRAWHGSAERHILALPDVDVDGESGSLPARILTGALSAAHGRPSLDLPASLRTLKHSPTDRAAELAKRDVL